MEPRLDVVNSTNIAVTPWATAQADPKGPDDITIRDAQPDDFAAVAAIQNEFLDVIWRTERLSAEVIASKFSRKPMYFWWLKFPALLSVTLVLFNIAQNWVFF